jgi:hypothetical protein
MSRQASESWNQLLVGVSITSFYKLCFSTITPSYTPDSGWIQEVFWGTGSNKQRFWEQGQKHEKALKAPYSRLFAENAK